MTEKEKYELSTYIPVKTIRETEFVKVELTENSLDGLNYIKKTYHSDKRAVFNVLADIRNAHIPEIYGVYFAEDTIVIEQYIQGDTLEQFISEGKVFSHSQVRTVFDNLLDAIETLHKNNIIHRDIKPSNVIITENGEAVLIDYSIARPYSDKRDSDTELLGTVGYAAPEQFGFAQSDYRTDIYALGFTLKKIINHRNASQKLCNAIERCVEFDPSRRFQSVDEIRRHIEKPSLYLWALLAIGVVAVVAAVILLLPKPAESNPSVSDNESANHHAEQTENNQSTEQSQSSEEIKPPEQTKPIEQTSTVEDTRSAEEAQSSEQSEPNEQTRPSEETKPIEETQSTVQTEPAEQSLPIEPVESDMVIYDYDYTRIVNTFNAAEGVPCIQIWENGVYEAEINIASSLPLLKITAEKKDARCFITIDNQRFEFEDTYTPEVLSYPDSTKIAEIIFYDMNGDGILDVIPVISDALVTEANVLKNYSVAWCIYSDLNGGFKQSDGTMLAYMQPFKIYDTAPGCLWSDFPTYYILEDGTLNLYS